MNQQAHDARVPNANSLIVRADSSEQIANSSEQIVRADRQTSSEQIVRADSKLAAQGNSVKQAIAHSGTIKVQPITQSGGAYMRVHHTRVRATGLLQCSVIPIFYHMNTSLPRFPVGAYGLPYVTETGYVRTC